MLNYKEPPKDYYSILWVQSRLQFLTKAFIYFPVGSGSMFKFIFLAILNFLSIQKENTSHR